MKLTAFDITLDNWEHNPTDSVLNIHYRLEDYWDVNDISTTEIVIEKFINENWRVYFSGKLYFLENIFIKMHEDILTADIEVIKQTVDNFLLRMDKNRSLF